MSYMLAESRSLVEANHKLVAQTRERITSSRRQLNQWFALAGGSSFIPLHSSLRVSVRTRLALGKLFPVGPEAWAGKGTGRPCLVCDDPICLEDVEYEVLRETTGTSAVVHLRCYIVWREESHDL